MSEFQEVPGRSACSPCRSGYTKFEAQVSKNVLFPSRLLECTRPVTPPSLRPGQVEPFLPPTRAIFQPLWGKTRAERGECLSISPPARGRCAAKRSLPLTLLARSSGQEDAISRRDRLLPGHPAQIWWTVIPGPGSLLVVHYLENFVDMTHFVQ